MRKAIKITIEKLFFLVKKLKNRQQREQVKYLI